MGIFSGQPRGNRGNGAKKQFRDSAAKDARSLQSHGSTSQQIIDGKGKGSGSFSPAMYDVYFDEDVLETAETHVVPRQSLTAKLHLKSFPTKALETRQQVSRQLDQAYYKQTGHIRMTEVTDTVTTLRSDRNLLRKGNPVRDIERETLSRRGSNTGLVKRDRYIDLTEADLYRLVELVIAVTGNKQVKYISLQPNQPKPNTSHLGRSLDLNLD